MSHFSLLVITKQQPNENDLQRLLAPFYEESGNDDSKWDWFQIGGRWTGALEPSYEPAKDPRNIESCDLCAGTGKRSDELGLKTRAVDPSYTCNGCDGKGARIKWPTQWACDVGTQVQVKNLNPSAELAFFAYLRDGQWVEKGDMGWWGIVHDEKVAGDWAAEKAKIIASLAPDEWLTVVDCHI